MKVILICLLVLYIDRDEINLSPKAWKTKTISEVVLTAAFAIFFAYGVGNVIENAIGYI